MIKRLIFDVDNTIIVGANFVPFVESTLKKVDRYSEENVEKFCKAIGSYEKEHQKYVKKDYLDYINQKTDIDFSMEMLDVFFEELEDCVPGENPNLKKVLEALSRKYELVLLTNFFGFSQRNRLRTMGLNDLFTECFGEELIKPNLEIYLKACGLYKPEECVMIGDDLFYDIDGAKKAGLHTIYVNTNNISPNENCDVTVESVTDITEDILNKLN